MAETKLIVNEVLENIAEDLNYVNYDIHIEPIDSGGANYSSFLNIATIKRRSDTHHLFVKVGTLGERIPEGAPNVYLNEIYAFTDLSKIYESLQDRYNVPQEHRLKLPKYYGCNRTKGKEIIVFENLVAEGYESFARLKSYDWEYAAAAVTELAKLHALSCAYGEYYPEDFKKVFKILRVDLDMENGPMAGYFLMSCTRAVDNAEDKYKDKLKKFLERFGASKIKGFYAPSRKSMLIHADFRPSNLMHKNLEDGKVDIKVLDLQTMQEGSPVVDLLYFIFVGSDEAFRAQYYHKLIDHYYSELAAAMRRLHLDPEKVYSRADFDYELKEKLPFGLTIAVFALPIVTVAEENAPKVDKELDMAAMSIEKTSDLFSDRLNGILNDYDRWGVFDENY